MPSSACIVSLKGFGDFVIVCRALRELRGTAQEAGTHLPILAGEHLRELALALSVARDVRFVETGRGYPAAYDIRRCGLRSALLSLAGLKRGLSTVPSDCELLFDRVGWRERFIGAPRPLRGYLSAPNVNIALLETLAHGQWAASNKDFGTIGATPAPGADSRTVRFFPISRLVMKNIPGPVLARLTGQARDAGLNCEIVLMGDEALDVPSEVPTLRIERNFASLIDALRSSAAVVSADSLPAHLADYFGVPVFVASPVRNEYWLPLSCFRGDSWCLFDDQLALPAWLSRTLSSLSGVAP